MDVREKLVEIVKKAAYSSLPSNTEDFHLNMFVTNLLAHGVTVQDGKPLDAFLHPVDAYKGLKAKYLVFKADTGERVGNCFVLRPDKDPAAVEAIRAYASATDNETLEEDIYNWVGKGEPVQEWISVDERLPEEDGTYLTALNHHFGAHQGVSIRKFAKDGETVDEHELAGQKYVWYFYDSEYGYVQTDSVTHWMPLPEPQKGD